MADLNKMFVLVPKGLGTTVSSIKEASKTSNKIYFLEEYNQIVAKGTVYGVDPVSSTKLTSTINALGATVAGDGTVTFDWTGFNYGANDPKDTLLQVLKKIDAALADIVTRVTKLENGIANSKTLEWVNDKTIEFSGSIKYVPAAEGVAAHIALVDEDNKELSTVAVSDIVGNGVLKNTSYDANTGYLTLTFAQADGTNKTVDIDLRAMLDINDMSIGADSENYLKVTLAAADAEGNTQAVFDAKTVKVAEASDTKTGLVDAKDVKDYVDKTATDLAVKAEGDDYITAAVDSADNKKIKVSADVQLLTATAGTVGVYNAEGAQTTAPVAGTLEGVDKSLVDGKDVAEKVKTYVDGAIAIEVARADAKVLAAVKALDVAEDTVSESGEGAINFKYSETDGKVAISDLSATYAAHTLETKENPIEPSKITTGIVSGTVLNSVLADMWETYKA